MRSARVTGTAAPMLPVCVYQHQHSSATAAAACPPSRHPYASVSPHALRRLHPIFAAIYTYRRGVFSGHLGICLHCLAQLSLAEQKINICISFDCLHLGFLH